MIFKNILFLHKFFNLVKIEFREVNLMNPYCVFKNLKHLI